MTYYYETDKNPNLNPYSTAHKYKYYKDNGNEDLEDYNYNFYGFWEGLQQCR